VFDGVYRAYSRALALPEDQPSEYQEPAETGPNAARPAM